MAAPHLMRRIKVAFSHAFCITALFARKVNIAAVVRAQCDIAALAEAAEHSVHIQGCVSALRAQTVPYHCIERSSLIYPSIHYTFML